MIKISNYNFSIILIVSVLAVIYLTHSFYAQKDVMQVKGLSVKPTISVVPRSTTEPTNIITPTQSLMRNKQIINLDPIVNCNTKSKGILRIKKSECSKSVDCLINGNYIFTSDNKACDELVAMSKSKSNQIPVYIPPTLAVPTLKTFPTYAPYVTPTPISSSTNSRNVTQECLNKFSALGSLDSSAAQQCYTNPNSVPPSTNDCYKSWEDYFRDHPSASTNTEGLGPNPPCH